MLSRKPVYPSRKPNSRAPSNCATPGLYRRGTAQLRGDPLFRVDVENPAVCREPRCYAILSAEANPLLPGKAHLPERRCRKSAATKHNCSSGKSRQSLTLLPLQPSRQQGTHFPQDDFFGWDAVLPRLFQDATSRLAGDHHPVSEFQHLAAPQDNALFLAAPTVGPFGVQYIETQSTPHFVKPLLAAVDICFWVAAEGGGAAMSVARSAGPSRLIRSPGARGRISGPFPGDRTAGKRGWFSRCAAGAARDFHPRRRG